MGFLYQKLHRPRSYDYLKKSEKYKTWDDRLRMPQFAWANDPAAVEEVMTFVLGLTNEKITAKYLAKTHTTPAQTAVAQGAKVLEPVQLRRLPRARDAQVHDPRRGQGRRGLHRLQGQPPVVVHQPRQRLSRRALSRRSPTIPRRSSIPNVIEKELGVAAGRRLVGHDRGDADRRCSKTS